MRRLIANREQALKDNWEDIQQMKRPANTPPGSVDPRDARTEPSSTQFLLNKNQELREQRAGLNERIAELERQLKEANESWFQRHMKTEQELYSLKAAAREALAALKNYSCVFCQDPNESRCMNYRSCREAAKLRAALGEASE